MKTSTPFFIIAFISSTLLVLLLMFPDNLLNEKTLNEWHWDVIIEEKRIEGYYISAITMKRKADNGWQSTWYYEPNSTEVVDWGTNWGDIEVEPDGVSIRFIGE